MYIHYFIHLSGYRGGIRGGNSGGMSMLRGGREGAELQSVLSCKYARRLIGLVSIAMTKKHAVRQTVIPKLPFVHVRELCDGIVSHTGCSSALCFLKQVYCDSYILLY